MLILTFKLLLNLFYFICQYYILACDKNITIPNGDLVPHDVNDTREGALANIICDTGYVPDRHTVKCLNTGNWENASCLSIGFNSFFFIDKY